MTPEEFFQRAVILANSPIDGKTIFGKTRLSDGSLIKYNKATNEIIFINKKGEVETMFRPTDGYDYYKRQ